MSDSIEETVDLIVDQLDLDDIEDATKVLGLTVDELMGRVVNEVKARLAV